MAVPIFGQIICTIQQHNPASAQCKQIEQNRFQAAASQCKHPKPAHCGFTIDDDDDDHWRDRLCFDRARIFCQYKVHLKYSKCLDLTHTRAGLGPIRKLNTIYLIK